MSKKRIGGRAGNGIAKEVAEEKGVGKKGIGGRAGNGIAKGVATE
jgi:hypothetical protein